MLGYICALGENAGTTRPQTSDLKSFQNRLAVSGDSHSCTDKLSNICCRTAWQSAWL